MLVEVNENWSYLASMGDFFRMVMADNQIRLYDAKGLGPIDPNLLPPHIGDLQNDPFRSLAALAKSYGCFSASKSAGTPYAEFMWGDYFRRKLADKFATLQIQRSDNRKWCAVRPYSPSCVYNEDQLLSSILPDALELCNTTEAMTLPGYQLQTKPKM